MFIFNHLADIFVLLLLALLVFGPRKLIAMGSDLGRAFSQLREATKDISWSDMLSGNFEEAKNTPPAAPFDASTATPTPAQTTPPGGTTDPVSGTPVVESTLVDEEPPRLR